MTPLNLNLDQLRFGAKIDFITLANHRGRRIALPPLEGQVKWSRRHHYKRFTIHDPSPQDIVKLMAVVGSDAPILEMEVSVDVTPAKTPDVSTLATVMVEMFGRRLCPSAPSLAAARRRAWRPSLRRLVMLGDSPLQAADQFLLGKRTDPAQVKCYLKQTDQGQQLDDSAAVARVEVRLAGDELSRIGVSSLICLDGFQFRKQLTPYFRHCTPVQRGGRGRAPVRRSSEIEINDRIGQALLRLERRHKGLACAKPASETFHHFTPFPHYGGVGHKTL